MTVKIRKIGGKIIYSVITIKDDLIYCRLGSKIYYFKIKDIEYLKEKYSFRIKNEIRIENKIFYPGELLMSFEKREIIHHKEKQTEYLVLIGNKKIWIPSYNIWNKQTLYY